MSIDEYRKVVKEMDDWISGKIFLLILGTGIILGLLIGLIIGECREQNNWIEKAEEKELNRLGAKFYHVHECKVVRQLDDGKWVEIRGVVKGK